jgi:RNA polymerase sigma-70 factor (TIGR02960 family)
MAISTGAHGSATEATELAAALAGDAEAFRTLTQPYLRELHVHCYRMLGTVQDAEDALQETLLRAWRHLDGYASRSSFRSWLYRIATNVCLTTAARPHRDPPPPAWLADALAASSEPSIHLSPYPDTWLDELEAPSGNPAARYELRESVELAFLAAIQLLPPRQRAVLILRDVLNWSASEVAESLGATTVSVNSALQRARSTLERHRREGRLRTDFVVPPDTVEQSLVRRYIETWQTDDIAGFVALLKSDAVLTMPPLPLRYVGRPSIASFFALIPRGSGRPALRLLPLRANRQPLVATYVPLPGGQKERAAVLQVLTLDGDAIAAITAFPDRALFPLFGLPTERDAARTE